MIIFNEIFLERNYMSHPNIWLWLLLRINSSVQTFDITYYSNFYSKLMRLWLMQLNHIRYWYTLIFLSLSRHNQLFHRVQQTTKNVSILKTVVTNATTSAVLPNKTQSSLRCVMNCRVSCCCHMDCHKLLLFDF